MKKLLILFVLPFLMSFNNGKEAFYKFIGYVDNTPVFYDAANNVLVQKRTDEIQIFKKIDSNKRAVFIKDDLLVLEFLDEGKLFALLIKKEVEKKIPIKSKMIYVSGNENKVFYTDLKTLEIAMLSMEGERKINAKGIVVGFEDDCLYFSQESDSDIISANVDIFRIDIMDNKLIKEKVATNLSGEKTLVFFKGKYIYDDVLNSGEYRPSLINIKSGVIKTIEIPNEYRDFNAYFSLKENTINFYNPKNLETFSFDFQYFE